ncbi:DedA family protein [Helicobacter sp. 23-1044]
MDSLLQTLSESLGLWGYVILFFYSLGGGFVALLAAGIISSAESLNIFLCIVVAGFANLIGSSALFYLSRYQKSEVMRFLKNHRRKIALSHIWIKKFDFWIIFIHKYLYGIKTIVPMVVGFSKYSGRKFMAYNILASFLWAGAIGGSAFVMGETLRRLYEKYSNPYIFPAIGICVILIIIFLAKKATK